MIDKKNPNIVELIDRFTEVEKTLNDKRLLIGYYYSFNLLMNLLDYGKQHSQVSPEEKAFIISLSKDGFFLCEIALICDRIKSTIHDILTKEELTETHKLLGQARNSLIV